MAIANTKYQTTELRKSVRQLLYGNLLTRDGTASKDQRYINLMPETSKNLVNDLKKFYLVKRPGTVLQSTVVNAGAVGRGIWYWNGNTYSVFGNTFYKDTTSKQVLSTSTGMCGATPVFTTDGEKLFFCDGLNGYTIDSSGTVESVEKARQWWVTGTQYELGDTVIPRTHAGTIYYYTVSAISGLRKSGSIEPTWSTTIGNTVVDNDITWTCTALYDGGKKWRSSTAHTVGDIVVPTTENALWYKCVDAGTTGGSEPTWPLTIGDTVTDNGIVWECGGYYGGFPSPHIPQPVMLDGYMTLAEQNSVDIYNSWINNPYSWNPLDFVSAESFADPVVSIARQNSFILAFGENNTEWFFDAAYETGSPFARQAELLLQTGIVAPNAIVQSEQFCLWVGRSDAGKYSVWVLDSTKPREVSTEYIERLLSSETNISSVTGYGLRVTGHFLFIINLPTANKTLVYDLEESMWHEWAYNGLEMPFPAFTDAAGTPLLQHTSNGRIYALSDSIYSDFDQGITCTAITQKMDFDSHKRKFIHRVDIVGDQIDTDIDLSWTDDDYQTYSAGATLNLASRAYHMRGGAFRRRAYKLVHTDDTPLRLESLEMVYTQGRT